MKNSVKRLKFLVIIIAIATILFVLYIHSSVGRQENDDENRLVVVSPHPTEFVIPLIQEFENETGINVKLISCGTTDAIDRIIADKDIDVLWGGSLMTVEPYKDNFAAYKTLNRAIFMEEYKNVGDEFTCFSNVPSVIMYNKDIIGDIEINGYADLLDPRLKGQIAFSDPSRSSSAFEHLVNMLYACGNGNPEQGWEYVEKLSSNLSGILLPNSSQVYNGVANGQYKVGLTFEEAAVTMIKNNKHIGIVYMDEGVVCTPDVICINKDSARTERARRFVDFLTSKDTQRVMASDLGRRSVRKDVEASSLVIPIDDIKSINVDKDEVIAKKSEWLERFEIIVKEEADE